MELGRLGEDALGYAGRRARCRRRRNGIGGGTVLEGKARGLRLAAITGGNGRRPDRMAIPQKSKARARFEDADREEA